MGLVPMNFDSTWMNQANTGFACIKQKFRFEVIIRGVCADGVPTLPPSKFARPNISFKETEAVHLGETIYFAGRPEYKPIQLVLYDLHKPNAHPVMEWLKLYHKTGFATSRLAWPLAPGFKKNIDLRILNGCGDPLEYWIYQEAWPQTVEFGELDMGESAILTADITLRYSRAFLVSPAGDI